MWFSYPGVLGNEGWKRVKKIQYFFSLLEKRGLVRVGCACFWFAPYGLGGLVYSELLFSSHIF